MTTTKNQFLRYEILHELLSNYKLEKDELLNKLNSAMEERGHNKQNCIGKRMLVNDLNYIEDQGAEIHRPNKSDKFYYYQEQFIPEGSQFSEEDLNTLRQSVDLLKNIAGFRIAKDVEDILRKLKYTKHIINKELQNLISFEDHTIAQGTEWLDTISDAMHYKVVLKIVYKPFVEEIREILFHPYFLKEYRNRWFAFGRNKEKNELNIFALDRIQSIKNSNEVYIENDIFEPEIYFEQLIGVTWPKGAKPDVIELNVNPETAPYIITKPLHKSQKVIKKEDDGSLNIKIVVVINPELISTIFSYRDGLKVLSPNKLKVRISKILSNLNKAYK